MQKTVIIGNGISGVTAARHIRKNSDNEILIISGESEYFFSRTALMYVYMGHMKFEHTQPYEPYFWKKNRIDLLQAWVSDIDSDLKQVVLSDGSKISYDNLILATGSKSNKFGWKGEDIPGVQGLYKYQDLLLAEENSKEAKRAVIIGGGLIGIELAEMFLSRNIAVTFLVRENKFWGNVLPSQDSELISRHIKEHHVDLRFEEELEEVIAGTNGRVSKIKTKKGEIIDCEIVGLTAGVSPNVDFLKSSKIQIERGIVVNEFFETNIKDIYAIGDCAQFSKPIDGRRPIEQVWYTGRIMGETLAQTITGNKCAYQPGNWFNSAKFFDIEYQTYGWVHSELKVGEEDFYWEDETGKIALHFVYEKESKKFLGVNTFGLRLRHELMDRYLNKEKSINFVLEHLKDANFDPEFYKEYEKLIIDQFNQLKSENLMVKKKSWARIFKS